MRHQEAIQALVKIEQSLDVNQIRVDGILLWPLIRLILWGNFLKTSDHKKDLLAAIPEKPPGQTRSGLSVAGKARAAWKRWREGWRFKNLPPVQALFFSRIHDYTDFFEGHYYNRHLDPLIDLAEGHYPYRKIEMLTSRAAATFPRRKPTVFIDPQWIERRSTALEIEGLAALQRELQKMGDSCQLDESWIYRMARKIQRERAFFLEALRRWQPRVVFLVCYYDVSAMALISAAKELGIRTVEIQHGRQNHHALYAEWSRIPPGGYDLVPEAFWAWGAAEAAQIANWQPANQSHRAVVGGNRWLAQWRTKDAFEPDDGGREFLAKLGQYRRVIVMTMQPIKEPIQPQVVEAIRDSPADWLWLLRTHPYQRSEIAHFTDALNRAGAKNFEMTQSSELPLYALLRRAHHHITGWSSVVFETRTFGIPTTIVHPAGEPLFREEIASGELHYASTSQDLLSLIENSQPGVPFAKGPIETSDRMAREAFDALFQNS